MSTLGQMVNRIADDLNRNDLDDQIRKAINRAIAFYRKERFWFNETTTTFATVDGQEAYGSSAGFPSTVAILDTVQLTQNATDTYLLIPKLYPVIKFLNEANSEGPPDFYSIYEEKMYLYPIPDQSYTVTLSYVQTYAELTDDDQSNAFTDNAEDLIESRATWWISSRILKDKEGAVFAKTEELDSLSALRSITRNYVATGEIESCE